MTAVRVATFAELDTATLYALLRLRTDVFVVEQACPYPELDGRDLEPGTLHCWIEERGQIVACLRLLAEPGGAVRLGRVATTAERRGEGLAGTLVEDALARTGRPVVADVQEHLVDWYARHGFVAEDRAFPDYGIPHVPMRLH